MSGSILDYNTVELDKNDNSVIIIDQTLLPGKTELIRLRTAQEIWDAIYLLKVRGAPAIGVTAAFGMYVISVSLFEEIKKDIASGKLFGEDAPERFKKEFEEKKEFINSSRPTAVNLSWALKRMDEALKAALPDDGTGKDGGVSSGAALLEKAVAALYDEAAAIQNEDIETCRKLGEYGLSLIKKGDGILTHCNAGQLATSRYGTATSPIYLGYEKGYDLKVYADETRPLLQGARLTAYELQSAGVDVTLICDNMAYSVMKKGLINAVFVGCDRVAANGDVANKIGTGGVATIAKRFNIPFYVCAPTSTIDLNTPCGDDIKIEQRPADEVTEMWYERRMAPDGVKVYNPAFDVTDNEYISAIITEYGIAYPPYDVSLKNILEIKKKG
ncbi:MAG: S-methyl-5-thioribose-1-phosphate isomerase [Lachnospiraceae bacterium]|nr:S-methyl-5-thioribose-1-phosphate isomerase [Lachnospiraceae bacterium]